MYVCTWDVYSVERIFNLHTYVSIVCYADTPYKKIYSRNDGNLLFSDASMRYCKYLNNQNN